MKFTLYFSVEEEEALQIVGDLFECPEENLTNASADLANFRNYYNLESGG